MLTPEQIEFLANLAPAPDHWGGTGALPLHADRRDYDLRQHPAVRAQLEAGVPAAYDLSPYVKQIMNQGAEGSCTCFATSQVIATDDSIRRGVWVSFAAHQLYVELGGSGDSGVDPRGVLQRCVDVGAPKADGSGRVKIAAYAWVPQEVGTFRETIKAAIAAGKPCVVATLLPSNFGWSSSGEPTTGYHELAAVGYTADGWLICANSWGPQFGNNGFVRLSFDYLEGAQFIHGYVFSYTIEPRAAPAPPVPIPVPPPIPTPVPVPPIPTPLPPIPVPPIPVPVPVPTPGGLQLQVICRTLSSVLEIWCGVRDAGGRPVAATVTGTLGTRVLPSRLAQASGVPAVWIETGNPPGVLFLSAMARDGSGRTGSAAVAAPGPA